MQVPPGSMVTTVMTQVGGGRIVRGNAIPFRSYAWAWMPQAQDMQVPGVYRLVWNCQLPDGTTAVLPAGDTDYMTIRSING